MALIQPLWNLENYHVVKFTISCNVLWAALPLSVFFIECLSHVLTAISICILCSSLICLVVHPPGFLFLPQTSTHKLTSKGPRDLCFLLPMKKDLTLSLDIYVDPLPPPPSQLSSLLSSPHHSPTNS